MPTKDFCRAKASTDKHTKESKQPFVSIQKIISRIRQATVLFVKIIPLKNDNCVLTLRKWLFCVAKQPLLPCKTYAFRMQNNRFYKALINK
ncbi:hypothetical protein CUB97_10610 [Prevotella intermedia]|uniref:Uncharacterized protein n=1 Tax=Prevotella intermedia TaxID=28131 RepID=A0A2M8M3N6_PREIN|nr:hypothetical protein CUB97_10610 [Prevotella intermedia]